MQVQVQVRLLLEMQVRLRRSLGLSLRLHRSIKLKRTSRSTPTHLSSRAILARVSYKKGTGETRRRSSPNTAAKTVELVDVLDR